MSSLRPDLVKQDPVVISIRRALDDYQAREWTDGPDLATWIANRLRKDKLIKDSKQSRS